MGARSSGPRSRSSACSAGWSPASGRGRAIGETALAVDAEAASATGSRARSSWRSRSRRRPDPRPATSPTPPTTPLDDAAETDRFVRRQRRDALAALRTAPPACSGRASRDGRPASLVVALLLLVAGPALPNPQDAVIAQQQQVREAARTTGRAARSASPRSSRTRARTPTIRGPGSPRSCATSRASCASARTTSTPTSPGSARSRPTSARRSIRPTSSGRRR